MKWSGVVLILAGIIGAGGVYSYDLIVKSEGTITLGPRSGLALGITVLMIIIGVVLTAASSSYRSHD